MIEKLYPLNYIDKSEYSNFWLNMFSTILHGFWSRLIFVVLVVSGFWIGVKMRNPVLAGICLILAVIVAYGAGCVNIIVSLMR